MATLEGALALDITSSHSDSNNVLFYDTIADIISSTEVLFPELTLEILDIIAMSEVITGPRNTHDILADNLSLSDGTLIGFLISILDSISTSDTPQEVHVLLSEVIDSLSVLDSPLSLVSLSSTISDIIEILDSISHGIPKVIAEIVAVSDILTDYVKAVNAIISTVLMSDSNIEFSTISLISTDTITQSDLANTSSLFNSFLSDSLIISIKDGDSGAEYISYLLSPETFSVSTYSNYNFYNSARYLDNYLFINSQGLFKYGGDTDNSEDITATIKTAALSFGTSNLKQIPNFYLGLSNSNKIVLKVSVDGKAVTYYKLNKTSENLTTQKISIGKGLIGRYFQFELITQENTQLEVESLEFYPLILKRKL